MKKEQSLRIKIAKIALNLLVQLFESVTIIENTQWHLFNINLIFWIKKPRLLMESVFIRPASIKVRTVGRGRWIRFSRAFRKTVHRTVFCLTAIRKQVC